MTELKNCVPYEYYKEHIENNNFYEIKGKVKKVIGLTLQVEGIETFIGEICKIKIDYKTEILAEVVGFKENASILMPLGDLEGVGPGCQVIPTKKKFTIKVGSELIGKVLDGLGRPINDEILELQDEIGIYNKPPNPLNRQPISEIMETGVRAIDGMITCAIGQRMGIFAGSGVGKSTLMGQIAKSSKADINVIALIGERNRELLNVLNNDLGEEGLSKSIVVCATSDQPALIRLKGAFVATAIAEYFRDKGLNVMMMMDSVTRFAMAQREVGLAIGEPPATKGYTPSVYALLPKLLERSGNSEKGSITAFYTVLVEGDDFNEPIADSVRGILDGHIVLSRKLAAKNHFPAIDINESISRLMKEVVDRSHYNAAGKIRETLSEYIKSEDLINIGAYIEGTNSKVDEAIKFHEQIQKFLKQDSNEKSSFTETLKKIETIFV